MDCPRVPWGAKGTITGQLNGEDLGIVDLNANISTIGPQRTTTAHLKPLTAKHVSFYSHAINTKMTKVVKMTIYLSLL